MIPRVIVFLTIWDRAIDMFGFIIKKFFTGLLIGFGIITEVWLYHWYCNCLREVSCLTF